MITGSKPQVLVVYQHLPHYRYGVFKSLTEDRRVDVHFAADRSSADGSIPVLDDSHLPNIHWVRNVWFKGLLWQRGLVSLIMRRRWDAIVFLGDAHYVSTWLGSALTRAIGTPTYFWTIGWHRREAGAKKHFRTAFYRLADMLLLYGDYPKQFGTDMNYPAHRMSVIYNSSFGPADDGETYTPAQPRSDPFLIGCVIRLNPAKQLHLMIEAAAILRSRGWSVEVEILGDGPERDRIQRTANELAVPLSLPGAIYDAGEIKKFYDRVAVVVVPSQAGLSTTQSMRHGRPVITHADMEKQAPECEAVRPGVTGDLYREGSVTDLADTIERWLSRQSHEAMEVAHACHAEIRSRWSPSAHSDAIISAIVDRPAASVDTQHTTKESK